MSQVYEIWVEGKVEETWSSWFGGLAVTPSVDGNTLLAGPLADQAALHGVLMKIRDLGLTLISVTRKEENKRRRNVP